MGRGFTPADAERLKAKAAEIWEAGKTDPDEPKPVTGWRGRLCRWIVGRTVYTMTGSVTVCWLDGTGHKTECDSAILTTKI